MYDREKTHEMIDKAQQRASVLVLGIRGLFVHGSDADASALEWLAIELATILDELVVATAPPSIEFVTVELTAIGEKKIEVIKLVRALTGLGLKESKDSGRGRAENLERSCRHARRDRDQARAGSRRRDGYAVLSRTMNSQPPADELAALSNSATTESMMTGEADPIDTGDRSQAELLLEIAASTEFFHTADETVRRYHRQRAP